MENCQRPGGAPRRLLSSTESRPSRMSRAGRQGAGDQLRAALIGLIKWTKCEMSYVHACAPAAAAKGTYPAFPLESWRNPTRVLRASCGPACHLPQQTEPQPSPIMNAYGNSKIGFGYCATSLKANGAQWFEQVAPTLREILSNNHKRKKSTKYYNVQTDLKK